MSPAQSPARNAAGFATLITPRELMDLQQSGARVMVFDCSFDLMNPAAGEEQYRASHIAGAVYASLDHDLSDSGVVGADGVKRPHPDAASGGRHPLPSREKFAMWLSRVGFANDMQAVVYDRQGANFCGRLWWMLKWAGHEAVAVLDGGLQGWQAEGGAVASGVEPARFQTNFAVGAPLRQLVTVDKSSGSWDRPRRRWWMHARLRATAARWSRWTRWPAIFPVRSTARSARTWTRRAGSSRPQCCARNSPRCSRAAIRPRWCTSAAAA